MRGGENPAGAADARGRIPEQRSAHPERGRLLGTVAGGHCGCGEGGEYTARRDGAQAEWATVAPEIGARDGFAGGA